MPDAVLVGGSAAAYHAGHRLAETDDHVVNDLRSRFDDVLSALEDSQGWVTARLNRPVLILGSLDGVETGVRNLIRTRPLEVEQVDVPAGMLRVPTLAEITRIKAGCAWSATPPATTSMWWRWWTGSRSTPDAASSPRLPSRQPGRAAVGGDRRLRGMTQATVAARMGISQSDVSKLERRNDLRLSTLRQYWPR